MCMPSEPGRMEIYKTMKDINSSVQKSCIKAKYSRRQSMKAKTESHYFSSFQIFIYIIDLFSLKCKKRIYPDVGKGKYFPGMSSQDQRARNVFLSLPHEETMG